MKFPDKIDSRYLILSYQIDWKYDIRCNTKSGFGADLISGPSLLMSRQVVTYWPGEWSSDSWNPPAMKLAPDIHRNTDVLPYKWFSFQDSRLCVLFLLSKRKSDLFHSWNIFFSLKVVEIGEIMAMEWSFLYSDWCCCCLPFYHRNKLAWAV